MPKIQMISAYLAFRYIHKNRIQNKASGASSCSYHPITSKAFIYNMPYGILLLTPKSVFQRTKRPCRASYSFLELRFTAYRSLHSGYRRVLLLQFTLLCFIHVSAWVVAARDISSIFPQLAHPNSLDRNIPTNSTDSRLILLPTYPSDDTLNLKLFLGVNSLRSDFDEVRHKAGSFVHF
jgi:hypothetical protein